MILTKSAAVRLKVLTPALAHIFYRLSTFHETRMAPQPKDLVITSINDGKHSPASKHYIDLAIDLRSHNFENDEQKLMFAFRLQDFLGPKFRILLENIGTKNEHFHIQVKKGETFG